VPTIVINVRGASSARVTIDGAEVPAAALGVSRPIDPGPHVVRAEAQGFQPAQGTVAVDESKNASLTLTLSPAPAAAPDAVSAAPAGPRPGGSGSSTQRTVGFVGLSVGGAGLAMGIVAGAFAMGKHGDLAQICPGGHCSNQQAAINSYHLVANVSTAGFVVGGVLAATGVVLVATAPRRTSQALFTPVIGPRYAALRGSF
jgi:hypothetical protein